MKTELPGFTARAALAISKLLLRIPDNLAGKDLVPGVSWIHESNSADFETGPAIGLNLREDVPAAYIVKAHGIELAIFLPQHILDQFGDHNLDYCNNKFVYVPKYANER